MGSSYKINRLNVGSDITLDIYAKDYYSRFCLEVKKGDIYVIKSDLNQVWYDTRFYPRTPLGGDHFWLKKDRNKRVSAPVFSLCGTINESEDDTHFKVNFSKEFEIQKSGNLHFFANDHKWKIFYKNNHGMININMTRKS